MTAFKRISLAGFLICLAVLPAAAQEYTESIDVRVVNVETVVTDAQGQKVKGLTAADFRLLVDGREVPVEYFSEIEEGIAADLERLGPEDRMAVLAFDGRKLDVLCPWTADRGALAAALAAARQRPTGGGQYLAQIDDMAEDVELAKIAGSWILLEMLGERRHEEAYSQAGYTTGALAAALEGFAAPPGRKVLFLITAGWQIVRAPAYYGPVVRTANRLGYTLYPVDTVNLDPKPLGALEWLAGTTGGKVVKAA